VLEPLSGYLLLAERLAGRADREGFAEGWNFGPADEDAWTVYTVVERLAELWGGNVGWRTSTSPQPPEASFLKVDASKARALLGWRPRLGIEQALEWTVKWYRRHAEGASARKLCQEQIARYECMALEQSGDCQNGTR
jgi:CDP-glucose 4,6-dehydratase